MADSSSSPSPSPSPSASPLLLDPAYVFELIRRRRPRELLLYVDSLTGAFGDPECYQIRLAARAMLPEENRAPAVCSPEDFLRARMQMYPFQDEDSANLYLARYAWSNAKNSRLCAAPIMTSPVNVSASFSADAEVRDYAKSATCNSRNHPSKCLVGKKNIKNVTVSEKSEENINVSDYESLDSEVLLPEKSDANPKHIARLNQLSASKSRPPAARFPMVLQENSEAKGEGRMMPLHEYTCTWSTFQVPAGCVFPDLAVSSPLLYLYTPVKSTEEGELLKHQFLCALASSPKWWRNLVSEAPLPRRNEVAAMDALTRAHGPRDRSLLKCVEHCMECPGKEKSPADWVCSCCSKRLCGKCLASACPSYHGPCRKPGALGILPEARDVVMPLMAKKDGLTLYCVQESIYLVEADHRGVLMKRDGFCLREYFCLDDVQSRTRARSCMVLYHISRAGDLQEIFCSPLT